LIWGFGWDSVIWTPSSWMSVGFPPRCFGAASLKKDSDEQEKKEDHEMYQSRFLFASPI
jgi:hypothetical protein